LNDREKIIVKLKGDIDVYQGKIDNFEKKME
jgi:hypothetical protein